MSKIQVGLANLNIASTDQMQKIASGLQLSRRTVFEKELNASIDAAIDIPQKGADVALVESHETLTKQQSKTLDGGFGLTKSSGLHGTNQSQQLTTNMRKSHQEGALH